MIEVGDTVRTDILVIGSGIAGLSFALKAAENHSVAIITKKASAESNTNLAQGGIAAVVSSDDSPSLHVKDTMECGVGLCHSNPVQVLVEEGPARIQELIEIGVAFTRQHGRLHVAREGGHSRNRIVHAHDLTGKEVERALLHRIAQHRNITVFEHHISIDLITEHNLGLLNPQPVHCWGVYALDINNNRVRKFLASKTLLSTGGLGHVYLHTTNPLIATGDGVAMAYRAGAKIGNMEFIQFHPTALYKSGSPAFLISEAVRGFGGVLKKMNDEEFMHLYDPRASLAPRDIVARAIDTELKKSGDEFVYLDLRHLPAEEIKKEFPNIYERCLTHFKIDITKELIPVVPAAHYACGGVVCDLYGRTDIENLYACGEVSMTGVHGANRLASNSLLEAIVFADRAAKDATALLRNGRVEIPEIPAWDDSGTLNTAEWVLIQHERREIQELMWDYVGIVRSTPRLQRAARRLAIIREEVEAFYKRTKVSEGLIELRNLGLVAELIVRSAMLRRESRGLHYTTDFPRTDDANWLHDTILSSGEIL